MSDPCLAARWQNYNSQNHLKAVWEEAQLSLLWPKSRPESAKRAAGAPGRVRLKEEDGAESLETVIKEAESQGDPSREL
jgi:hypothetical protein